MGGEPCFKKKIKPQATARKGIRECKNEEKVTELVVSLGH